ncbi:UV radiation resistance protein-like protein [Amylocarpus encephaloides]|uniref:Autophagy-related protein 14 n=1 Tax=Amylocarpus encephaloides TaxID=45428 RepID=A0A9P8C952_9HELO|nr:UV radiation resistance protein-like protein [Amylocarpus encephaloides]
MVGETSRPLLLPQNRKIRHLQGIYVRNLTLTRPRGHTIDDAALNKTPQKLQALRESPLHHTASSEDLRRPQKTRRSSSNWVGASPGFRQKKLEDVIDSRMADTFFTLHCEGQEDPIYISEVVEKAMNPTFRFFDLSSLRPAVTRLRVVLVKIWVKRGDFTPLLEEEINLQTLQFIGTLENHSFPPNCIVFHLTDGIYTIDLATKPPIPRPAPSLPTSSYSALMRLSNLDESIQDALATREELANQINAIFKDTPIDESPQAREKAALASRYLSTERKLLRQSIRRRAEIKASISARRNAIRSGEEIQARALEDINNAQENLTSCQSLVSSNTAGIHQQRRRVCEDVLNIFPIEPTTSPLLFTICGLSLPNSHFDDADEDTTSAALGFVARVVDMLQYYLSVPLPYPISPYGSRSIIHDYISTLQDNQRTFPLYNKGTLRFRFEYGVFLLNKNIECLAESQALKVLDIRQTLPNLKYLLYVCSAGTSELPTRKSGGVKGLLSVAKPWDQSSASSRRGSADSGVAGGVSEQVRMALENSGVGKMGPSRGGNGNGGGVFGANHVHSLRTSGLRENVAK